MIRIKNIDKIGGKKWKFSDEIFFKLTRKKVDSNYNPSVKVCIKEFPEIVPDKKIFFFMWGAPTFKDLDCNYLVHVYDKSKIDYIISTSSGNTVEGLARVIKKYNQETNKNVQAILLVPELSSYKVARNAIENNPYTRYVVLKNSTLDSIRVVANQLINKLSEKYRIACADTDLKTAAYAQMGLFLDESGLMNDDICFVQTVSGGMGPTGFIEAAYKLNVKPEILIVQPKDGKSTPTIDALEGYSQGKDPFEIIERGNYMTPDIETTLGSAKPLYAIRKYIQWRENGGKIKGARVTLDELSKNKERVLKMLIDVGVYPNEEIGQKYYELEKSGFMAIIAALNSIKNIKANNIIINFTGRFMDPDVKVPITATPDLIIDPSKEIDHFIEALNLD